MPPAPLASGALARGRIRFTNARTKREAVVGAIVDFNQRKRMAELIRSRSGRRRRRRCSPAGSGRYGRRPRWRTAARVQAPSAAKRRRHQTPAATATARARKDFPHLGSPPTMPTAWRPQSASMSHCCRRGPTQRPMVTVVTEVQARTASRRHPSGLAAGCKPMMAPMTCPTRSAAASISRSPTWA